MMQIFYDIILYTAIYCLISLSFSVIYYPSKFFNVFHAIVIVAGAYFVLFYVNIIKIPFYFSVVLAIISAILLGLMSEKLLFHHLRKRGLPILSYLIASIGLYVVLQNCISLYFGNDTKMIYTSDVIVGHQIFGAYITTIQIITIFITVLLFISVILFLNNTLIGKSIRAVSSNPELCNIYGISSDKIILIAFGIGSALASIGGILTAMDKNMTPTFGFNLLLYGVVAMIIGGVGNIRWLLAGSLLVATTQHLSAYYLDTKWMDAITYIILILFLIWKPLGFSGKLLNKIEI